MKRRILLFIAITLGMVTGCASAGGTANTETAGATAKATPRKTTAELKQLAQKYEYEGQFDEANEVYRQLIDRYSKSFKSVLYQHQILLNAQAQSDLNKLLVETYHTVLLFEKAKDEHFDGATPEAIAQEKETLARFLYLTANNYALLADDNLDEKLIWGMVFFRNLYFFYYDDVLISDVEKNNYTNQDYVTGSEEVRKFEYHYVQNVNNEKKLLNYYHQIFDLYDRGVITNEMLTPLYIIQIDIQETKTETLDAIMNYILAFAYHRFGPSDIKKRHQISEIVKQAFYTSVRLHQECELDICLEKRKKDPKIPDCDQFLTDVTKMLGLKMI